LKEKRLYTPAIGELLIFTKCIVGYIEGEEALYLSNRRVAYFYKVYCRIY
jgi:hypothetical protein